MSLIDDVLIAVEDQQSLDIGQLHELLKPESKQAVFSVVGRLAKRNFLKTNSSTVSISEKGKDYVYNNLDAIEKFEQPERPFLLVLFEIPETHKVLREKFRTSMNQLGFGSLKRGIMLGAVSSAKEVEGVIGEMGLRDRVLILKTQANGDIMKGCFIPWQFGKINQSYAAFINKTSKFLGQKKDDATRIKAKQLVLQFARAVKVDPVLPKNMNDSNYLGPKAYDLYLKLKPLCY